MADSESSLSRDGHQPLQSPAILGAITSASLVLRLSLGGDLGGDRGESAEGKPLGPVFGLLYPIGKVPAGHDGGCEFVKVGCWFVEGGKQQSFQTSPCEWLGIRLGGG